MRDVDPTKPTPAWMVARLTLAGIRSLGILIDITNYVMVELGQPIHGYDLDKLQGGITVRRANPGEKLETLDGKVRTLHPEDLLITDESGPIGLAGVMGGGTTEMTGATRNVLIEAAVFDTVSIARTARRHKLPSEASRRFERGVDPLIPFVAARRVADLMVEHAGGTLDTEVGGALFATVEIAGIDLPRGFVEGVDRRRLHRRTRSSRALEMIGCELYDADDHWSVHPPSWRPDLTDKWTLAEEVARIEGYDRIPSILPTPPSGRGLTAAQQGRRRVSNALAAAGYVETPSFGFTTEELNDLHGSASGDKVPSIKLANPLDGQSPFLRRSLVPGLLQVAHRNVSRGFTDLSLFETGVVFLPEVGVEYGTSFVPPLAERPDDATLAELDASIPPQHRHVAVLLAGSVVAQAARSGARRGGPRRRPRRRARHRRPRRESRSTSPRPSARRFTRAAPACCPWTASRSATSESCCPRWPRHPIFPVACTSPSSISISSSRSRARRSSPSRSRRSLRRRRTCRSCSTPPSRPRPCALRWSTAPVRSSSRRVSSTTIAARVCPRARRA